MHRKNLKQLKQNKNKNKKLYFTKQFSKAMGDQCWLCPFYYDKLFKT